MIITEYDDVRDKHNLGLLTTMELKEEISKIERGDRTNEDVGDFYYPLIHQVAVNIEFNYYWALVEQVGINNQIDRRG